MNFIEITYYKNYIPEPNNKINKVNTTLVNLNNICEIDLFPILIENNNYYRIKTINDVFYINQSDYNKIKEIINTIY